MAGWIVVIVTAAIQIVLALVLKVDFWKAWIFVSLGGLSFCAYTIAETVRRGGA